jgi:hypothetical protein
MEEHLTSMYGVIDDIDAMIYRIGDCEKPPSEDQLLNMLIGMNEMFKCKYDRAWNTFERLVKETHEIAKLNECCKNDCGDRV